MNSTIKNHNSELLKKLDQILANKRGNIVWNYSSQSIVGNQSNMFINNNSSNDKDENIINKRRLIYLEDKIEPIFISLLKNDEISVDYSSPAEKLFIELLNENYDVTLKWLNDLYVKYFHNEKIHINILRLIGNLKESQISSLGILIATSALCNKNIEIKELGMRAFENWGSLNSYNVLLNLDITQKWLDDYRIQIVKDISKDLCLT